MLSAKLIGWRDFEGVPGVCMVIGWACTIACVGSCLTLTVLSLNRYVLICHHTIYRKIFTYRNSIIICVFIVLFACLLIVFNFFGIGDHSFDYKSFECVWDRMATHDFTIFFSIVLVWMPMTVSGIAYGRTYWYVYKVRKTVAKSRGKSSVSRVGSTIPMSEQTPQDNNTGGKVLSVKAWAGAERDDEEEEEEEEKSVKGEDDRVYDGEDSQTSESTVNMDQESDLMGPTTGGAQAVGSNQLTVPKGSATFGALTSSPPTGAAAQKGAQKTPATLQTAGMSPTTSDKPPGHPGLKLARPLFIIYVAFTTCWLPYSLGVSFDRYDTFPHELHAFITAFAHANSSVNWLVYYMTHNKMRRAFQGLLSCRRTRGSKASVQPLTTPMTVRSQKQEG
ncbi:D(2) dopamine receptor B-like [Littorina saxatilis]|uniref:D(2) dopamine receptor B-like n=1 Tax=Littorina saxatilis TaxID=31220 RepID=UPI0038B43288